MEDTAWAVLALKSIPGAARPVAAGRDRLVAFQAEDGRVPVHPDHSDAAWPTAPAVLAWSGSDGHAAAHERAVDFLLTTSGEHWVNHRPDVLGHDTSLKGWPWVLGAHSWVLPTALAVLALRTAGLGNHARLDEAVSLLLDRQLPGGGWNYGNTVTFGTPLPPMPETTGAALAALAGLVSPSRVEASLDYLAVESDHQATPQAVGWGLTGLAAWGLRPVSAPDQVDRVLARQDRLGPFDTASLALLGLALLPGGLNG